MTAARRGRSCWRCARDGRPAPPTHNCAPPCYLPVWPLTPAVWPLFWAQGTGRVRFHSRGRDPRAIDASVCGLGTLTTSMYRPRAISIPTGIPDLAEISLRF
jgi:hypothetical protein